MKPDLPTILITGANGQLGSEIRAIAPGHPQFNFLFADRDSLPIDDTAAVEKYFSYYHIDYCINCAAYTAVDNAENDKENACLINAIAAGNLAGICKQNNVRFIHISTDYVFDGNASEPMDENHITHPLGIYGASKRKGEELVLQQNADAVIVRTSWVYSSFGKNFVKTMLGLMKEREYLNVVNDQFGSPTYAADLAEVILRIINLWEKIPSGNRIFNYSNSGITTWFDFAMAIKKITGSDCTLHPIPTTQYPTPAKRPMYSVLDTAKISSVFNIKIPSWQESLKKCLQLLSAEIRFQ